VSFAVQLAEDGQDFLAALAVQGTRGLVGEDHGAAVHEGAPDAHPLLLAAGELARVVVVQAVPQAEVLEQPAGAGHPLGLGQAAIDRRNFGVLHRVQVGHEVVALEDEAEGVPPQGGQAVAVHPGHVHALDAVGAGGRLVEAPDDVHEGGLAGT